MLKRFLLNALSSFVGAWIALTLVVISIILLCIALAGNFALSSKSGIEKIKSRSILKIELSGNIVEREMPMEPDLMSLMNGKLDTPQSLEVITKSIREAAENDDVVAIYLNCGDISAGLATMNAIRHELDEFKKTTKGDKKIFAYADSYSQGCYYIASVADSVFMNPAGGLALRGLGGTNFYMKGLFDKLGLEFQVVKVGTYKSAVEPYILNDMSEPARAQMDTLLGNMWSYVREEIASTRKSLSAAKIDSLISKESIAFAKSDDVVKAGLVDGLAHERTVKEKLAAISGRELEKLNFIGPATMAGAASAANSGSKNQVAVLYAVGEIADGNDSQINFEKLVPVILDLADDENVKALVLRVNSPGGSVFGSDQIGWALDTFKAKGKPVVVSMGDYAASGGYWISAKASKIYADPLTITGSIGIFGLLLNVKGTLDKLGVNVATVSTNPGANFPSAFKPMTPEQLAVMQKYVERGYDQFVSRVAEGRKMKRERVLQIAEGRVWAASTAKKIGLVDELGYLQDAVDCAARLAGIGKNYNLSAYPEVEPNFWSLMKFDSMSISEFKSKVESKDEEVLKAYLLRRILSRKPLQAKMPEFRVVF